MQARAPASRSASIVSNCLSVTRPPSALSSSAKQRPLWTANTSGTPATTPSRGPSTSRPRRACDNLRLPDEMRTPRARHARVGAGRQRAVSRPRGAAGGGSWLLSPLVEGGHRVHRRHLFWRDALVPSGTESLVVLVAPEQSHELPDALRAGRLWERFGLRRV